MNQLAYKTPCLLLMALALPALPGCLFEACNAAMRPMEVRSTASESKTTSGQYTVEASASGSCNNGCCSESSTIVRYDWELNCDDAVDASGTALDSVVFVPTEACAHVRVLVTDDRGDSAWSEITFALGETGYSSTETYCAAGYSCDD